MDIASNLFNGFKGFELWYGSQVNNAANLLNGKYVFFSSMNSKNVQLYTRRLLLLKLIVQGLAQ